VTLKQIYFFSGSEYWRYDWALGGVTLDRVDLTKYPRSIAGPADPALRRWWPGLFSSGIDAAFCWRNGKVYLFSGDRYVRYDARLDAVDPGYPRSIGDNWKGVRAAGFDKDIDAALHWGNGQVYWFKKDKYLRLANTSTGWAVEPGYPKAIGANWPGVAGTGFERDISGCVNWGDGNNYWFKGDQFIRLTEKPAPQGKSMDPGYPKMIADAWPGVPTTGFEACVEWPYAEVDAGTFAMPSGAQTVSSVAGRKQASFAMNVDFVDTPHPVACAVGEYRQRVRGAFTRLGVDQLFQLANPNGGPPVAFHRTEFREDGVVAPPAGITMFYGHRDDPAGNADPNDQYLPQRDTGCQYRGLDTPGVPDIAGRGLTVEFEGSAMDRAAGEVLQSANWTVTIPE